MSGQQPIGISSRRRAAFLGMPWWAWVLVLILAGIEPATHVWIKYCPPSGTAPTGLHTGDSHVYLHCMRALGNDFYSPYASAHSPWGSHCFRYFALPTHCLYMALGAAATLLHLDHFLALGVFNGLAGAFYLCAAYRFLRRTAPKQADLAFLLFALGGGAGGVLYVASRALGLHEAASFDAVFVRYAQYELIEGGHLWPVLHMPRLYYTLALGCGFMGFAGLVKAMGRGCGGTVIGACGWLFAAQVVNMRVGTFVWAAAVVYLWVQTNVPAAKRLPLAAAFLCPVVVGGALTVILSRLHPTYSMNQFENVRESMWVSAFVSASLLHWAIVPREVKRSLRGLSYGPRTAALALTGYLVAFGILYAGYQLYYGNLWRIADTVVAVRISDWALVGAAAGGLLGLAWRAESDEAPGERENAWAALWLLLFLAGAISAWGGGWYMRLVPRRLMVLLGLPICLLSAQGLQQIGATRRRLARVFIGVMVSAGACSVAVSALYFQGPLGHTPGKGPFAYRHYEIMTEADARALKSLGPGRVLTPCYNPFTFAEVIALRNENPVAFGVGTFNHSDLRFVPMRKQVDAFFSDDRDSASRRSFVKEWDVDYVYCPDSCPVPKAVVAQLRSTPWLREVAAEDGAVLFEVDHERLRTR